MNNLISNIFCKNRYDNDQIKMFLTQDYQKHNISRLIHLDRLGFNFNNKSILEFGAGIGDHTYYLLIKGAKVLATDGRQMLVDIIKKRFDIETEKIDVENELTKIKTLPKFDIIYCYGFLYHISNPTEFLDSIKDKSDLLLLETCVSGDQMPDDTYIVNESLENYTQAISGQGCRPTRNWIYNKLKSNYKFVYTPKSQPNHPEFPKDWNKKYENSTVNLIRAIFIASNTQLENDNLQDSLPKIFL